ncbi:unnamed protein product [Acanthoscelides obtectus]|uniref:Uncharacterized protein n=1 Tax=Acanthoscelides obtectus TaxID=200917 RepID=A0A9P0KRG2_ACAOB|nr:unnamed protein product [Acanthoscelides obtectus]CAK1677375.1 hypothetical protein AOBTE_LOCUS31282 [Acanthoscelides obtectus]
MIRNKYFIYCTIMCLCANVFNYGRIIEDKRLISANLVFKAYIPAKLSFWGIFVWEHIHVLGLITLETSMDILIFTVVSLTIIQIKMLKLEIKKIFEDGAGSDSDFGEQMRKCNEHHTLILRYEY